MDGVGESNAPLRELKKVTCMATPMVAVTALQYLLQVVSLMMIGHLGELQLSGASMAISFVSVTGFSILMGMTGGLETLCGQAYGAGKFKKLGSYANVASVVLVAICFPISVIWLFTDKILILIRQDKAISRAAKEYAIYLIPCLFPYGILQVLTRFFQTQGLILQMLYSSFVTLCIHLPLCWLMVFKIHLGYKGAALSLSIAYWINVVFLCLYMKYSATCQRTRCPFAMDFLSSTKEFIKFGVPSAIMGCLEWWSYEMIILLSGLLPDPKLETSVISVCFSISYLHYFVAYGIASITSTRVSNELGADNPRAAKMVTRVVMGIGVLESLLVSVTLMACRRVVGHLFSSKKEIVNYVGDTIPYLCICIVMDSMQCVLTGIVKGSGWQRLGVCVNIGAYYFVGLPLAVVLAFVVHMRIKGLLIGLATGSFLQALLFGVKTFTTDWNHQATVAQERVLK